MLHTYYNIVGGWIAALLLLAGCAEPVAEECVDQRQDVLTSSMLSNQRIRGIAQDASGNVWVGTYRGLNRYNGHEIHQYFRTDNPNSLPDDQIWCVYADKQERLWVSTKRGLALYTDQDNFQVVPMQGSGRLCRQMLDNSQGELFLLTENAVLKLSEEKMTFEPVLEDAKIGSATAYFDGDDRLWLVTPNQVLCYSVLSAQLRETLELKDFPVQSSQLIGDQLWLASRGSIRLYDVMKHRWIETPASFKQTPGFGQSYIDCICPTAVGNVLIGTMNGIFYYNVRKDELKNQKEAGFQFEPSEFSVSYSMSDREGNLWLCSESQGVKLLHRNSHIFNSNSYLATRFTGKPVADIEYDHQGHALWIASVQEGLFHYDLTTHEILQFDLAQLSPEMANERLRPYYLLVDSEGCLWVSLMPSSLIRVRLENRRLKLVDNYSCAMPIVIQEDQQGTIWVGCYGDTFYSLKRGEKQFRTHHLFGNTFSYLSCLEPLKDGSFASLVNASALRFIDTEQRELLPQTIPADTLDKYLKQGLFLPTSLHEDAKGQLWIGTVSNGLFCYNRETGLLCPKPGVPCADISSIEEDNNGNIWVSTQNGLGMYNPDFDSFTNYYHTDGIGGNEFYDRASCKLPDGTLLFAGAHGLTVFNPSNNNILENPVLRLEDLKIFGQIVRPAQGACIEKDLEHCSEIWLGYRQTSFSISFATLDYLGDERYCFQYQLEGLDDKWLETGPACQALYASVPAGDYTFRVRVMNKDKTRVLAERSIPVYVAVTPWLSGAAIALYTLLVLGLAFVLLRSYHLRRRASWNLLRTEREREHERQVNRSNMRFFANVSHEFRTPLTIISGPVSQLMQDDSLNEDQRRLLSIVQRSVSRMLRLVNQMMDFHKLEDGALHLQVQQQDIATFLRQCGELFSLQAKDKQLSLTMLGMEEEFLAWFDADKVEKIVLNLLSNAVKYTPAGRSIDFSLDIVSQEQSAQEFPINTADEENVYLKIVVADTGDGIPEEAVSKIFERYYQVGNVPSNLNFGTGIGLYYTHKLVSLHHGYIKAVNRPDGHGAVLTVLLPASASSYDASERAQESDLRQLTTIPMSVEEKTDTEALSEVSGDVRKEDNRPRILVIDDESEIVLYVKSLLQRQYQVTGVYDADAGLQSIKECSPDLILCDVMMPNRSGFDFCKEVKSDLQLCHLPVILLTARATTPDQVEGLDAGADAYVTKPFDPAYLLALIGSILHNREKVRGLLSQATQTETLAEDVLSPQDNAFMSELYHLMEQELANPELDILHLTDMMRISRTKFYYKVKGLTGENPASFFKRYKLNRASELLKEGTHSIAEVSLLTGFSSTGSFSSAFKKHFGVSPSEYR